MTYHLSSATYDTTPVICYLWHTTCHVTLISYHLESGIYGTPPDIFLGLYIPKFQPFSCTNECIVFNWKTGWPFGSTALILMPCHLPLITKPLPSATYDTKPVICHLKHATFNLSFISNNLISATYATNRLILCHSLNDRSIYPHEWLPEIQNPKK